MAENTSTLLGNFNFRITLRQSAPAVSGSLGAASDGAGGGGGFGFSASASVSVGTGGVSASASAGFGPSAGTGTTLGEGGFQECTGLEVEMEVGDLNEGGRNDGIIRRVGRGKYVPLVLKRGMFLGDGTQVNADLWTWLQGILTGQRPVVRYDGVIEVLDGQGNRNEQEATVLATWTFVRGLPQKVSGPTLNAKTGDIAMEELHIAHEGLTLAI